MSITAEKRNGKLTGYWRVEVGGHDKRQRGRVKTHAEAVALEAHFRQGVAEPRREALGRRAVRVAGGGPTSLLELLQQHGDRIWPEGGNPAWRRTAEAQVRFWHGHMPTLAQVTLEGVEDAVDELLEDHSRSTVNRYLSTLSHVLGFAVDRGIVAGKPKLPWQREPKGRVRVLTQAEEDRLLQFLPEDMRAFIILAIETGCRKGELLRIKKHDRNQVDWLILPTTKAGEPQGVPLTPRAQEAFDALMRLGVPGKQRVRQQFEIAREKALLDDVCIHTMRHTRATRLLEEGHDLQVTQEFLRHSDIKTTLKYRHVNSTMLKAVAAKLGRKTA
jgi:integrase